MGSPRLTKANKQAISEARSPGRPGGGRVLDAARSPTGPGCRPRRWPDGKRGTVPDAEHRAALAELYEIDESVLFVEIESRLDAARELLRRPA